MNHKFLVSGIGTDVGKTVCSAIIAKSLNADYWKPVQCGELHYSDSDKIRAWTNNSVHTHAEIHRFEQAVSPHLAAQLNQVEILAADFSIPQCNCNLIVEGAGGVMVPLNFNGLFYIHVFQQMNIPLILISKHYVGSINHTILSIQALKQYNIPIEGILYVGSENPPTEKIIADIFQLPVIGHIPIVEHIDADFIETQAQILRNNYFNRYK